MKVLSVFGFLGILTAFVVVRCQSITNSNHFINRRCENPNRKIGTCVAIHDCQVLLQSERTFVEASRCGGGFGTTPFVCCSSDTGFSRESRQQVDSAAKGIDESEFKPTERFFLREIFRGNIFTSTILPELTFRAESTKDKSLYLPEPPTCGGEFIDNRIYGGRDTDLYEFPWMAFLEYTRAEPTEEAVCAGTLINSRYILTAAHCVEGPIVKQKGELVAVRLGLRDYTRRSLSFEHDQRWRIAEKIVHENYRSTKTPLHDIALLRLEYDIRYSKTVRPICLPSVLAAMSLKPNTKLTVAGWGATEYDSSSAIKQKVNVALIDQKFCKQQYGKLGLTIESSHMCAGGVANRDSCRGDSGAPLMHYRSGAWVLEGIVSFGRRCGYKDWPGVYVRVSSYIDWIINNLRS